MADARRWFGVMLGCLVAALAPAAAQDGEARVVQAPRPEWVVWTEIPTPRESRLAEVEDGVYYLVYDRQIRLLSDTDVTYSRTATKVIGRGGLESAGRLEFSFDPTEEVFSVHAVRIIRDGIALDRLPDLEFTIARREEGLASGLIDGDLTAYAEVPDVRVGDIVEYEISWETTSTLWPGGLARSTSVEMSVPVEFFRHRVLAPLDTPLTWVSNRDDAAPEVRELDGAREYVWSRVDPLIVVGESYVPAHHAEWGYIAYSTMSSWADVADWAVGIFDIDTNLPPSLDNVVAEIERDHADANGRVTAAVRHVQDNVRYVANEVGLGSHVPRSPAEVVRLGYGDCKDKALLLAAMLRRLGVEAYPVLTDISAGKRLPDWVPSPWAFDHAITVIETDVGRRWIDPTDSHQGGVFPDIVQPAYGFGLIVRPGETGLTPIETNAPDNPDLAIEEDFTFLDGGADGVEVRVITTYKGREADAFRWRLDDSSIRALTDTYLNYYTSLYPGIEATALLKIDDDRNANIVRSTESYFLPGEALTADGLVKAFPMRADAVLGTIEEITQANGRVAPVSLGKPRSRLHVIRLKDAGQLLVAGESIEIENDYFRFRSTEAAGQGWLNLEIRFDVLAAELPPEDFTVYAEMHDTIDGNAYLEIDLSPPFFAVDWAWWTQFSPEEQDSLVGAAFVIVFAIFMLIGAIISLRADAQFTGTSVFHPVSASKFVILSLATFGAYAMLWFWKNWRWSKDDVPRPLSPFGRALFSVFFYLPMYGAIRAKATRGRIPGFVAGVLALMYFAWTIVGRLGDRFTDSIAIFYIEVLSFIWVLPLVLMVNAQNRDHPEALAYNSRWTFWTALALILGLMFWALFLYGSAITLWPETFA